MGRSQWVLPDARFTLNEKILSEGSEHQIKKVASHDKTVSSFHVQKSDLFTSADCEIKHWKIPKENQEAEISAIRTIITHSKAITCLQVEGSLLISGDEGGTLILWDFARLDRQEFVAALKLIAL